MIAKRLGLNDGKINARSIAVIDAVLPEDTGLYSSIEVTTQPTKTTYLVGESLDVTGIVITAYDKTGTISEIVTNDCTYTPADGSELTTEGTNTITVKYGSLKTTFTISAYAVESIAVTTAPTKTTYKTGDALDLTGLVVTGSANSGAITVNITSACTFNPENGYTITEGDGTLTVTATYGSLDTSFNVTIANEPAWDSRGLAYNSWSTIQYYIKAGKTAGKMAVGNTKSVTINGKTITFELASINDGSNQYYPNKTADFISQTTVDAGGPYHGLAGGSWNNSSTIRNWLNGLYNNLDADLKNAIVAKTLPRESNKSAGGLVTSTDYLWAPAFTECCTNFGGDKYFMIYEKSVTKAYSMFSPGTSRDSECAARKRGTYSGNSIMWLTSSYCRGDANNNNFATFQIKTGTYYYSAQGSTTSQTIVGFRIG
jgi:hypothetical protein